MDVKKEKKRKRPGEKVMESDSNQPESWQGLLTLHIV
jgi:hypothetical protein